MHLGVIPDGNRRFMRKNGINDLKESYTMGINKFHQFLGWCVDLDVSEVTIYALSLENIRNRSPAEITTLLGLFSEYAMKSIDDKRIQENGVRVNFCGDRNYLSGLNNPIVNQLIENMVKLEDKTSSYSNLNLNIALAYGGRQEIINAVKRVMDSGSELNEENIRKHLWVSDDPDIIIRTAESRLSNFLLWQSAYSEIYFIDKLWQELDKEDLVAVLDDYKNRERRFGR